MSVSVCRCLSVSVYLSICPVCLSIYICLFLSDNYYIDGFKIYELSCRNFPAPVSSLQARLSKYVRTSMCVSVSIYLYICLSVWVAVCASGCLSIYLYLSLSISVYLYVRLCFCLSLSICLSIYLGPSICVDYLLICLLVYSLVYLCEDISIIKWFVVFLSPLLDYE